MNRKNAATAKRPVHHITRGKVEAAIWEREGKKGRFFQASFSRPYQTADGGFGSSESFGSGQLSELAAVAVEALVWIEAQRKPRLKNGHDEERVRAYDPAEAEDGEMYEAEF